MLKISANMKTYIPKKEEIKREWLLFDATDKVLGRLSSQIAKILMGKHKTIYTPHMDVGDHVIVVNAKKIKLTGKKWEKKIYYHHSGYPGGLHAISAKELLKKNPCRLIHLAVKRMLPKNKLGRGMLRRLRVYPEGSHPHIAQRPKVAQI
jgi:large subunit ribosomal protein L13